MVTRYEYDDAGRVIAATEEREPEWSRADVEALLAHLELQRVGSHGQPMVEATSPLANPANPDREWRYEIDVYEDFAAAALAKEQEAYKRAYGDDVDMSTLKWVVRKVDLTQAEAGPR